MGSEYHEVTFPIKGETHNEQVQELYADYNAYYKSLEANAIEREIRFTINNSEDSEYDTQDKQDALREHVYDNPNEYSVYSYTGTFLSSAEGLNVKHETLFNPKDFDPGDKWEQPNAQRVIDGEQGQSYWVVGAYCSS